MIGRFLRLFDKKGVTLIELLVAMVVLAIIATSATLVILPIYRLYERSNNLAEANTILDNISALIMEDVANATFIQQGTAQQNNTNTFTIKTTYDIVYSINDTGNVIRDGLSGPRPVLDAGYFKNKSITSVRCQLAGGVVRIEITLEDDDGGWTRTREYTARPVGLS